VAISAGLAAFALLIHNRPAGAFIAMAAVAILLAASVARSSQPLALFGLAPVGRRTILYFPVGLAVGALAALACRNHSGWTILPQGVAGFAFVAALIGGAEEIVYRGYVQGRLRPLGAAGAILGAAALHATYKTALFARPPAGLATDPALTATWTLIGGILFGALRQLSGNVLAPLVAHIVFDLLVYGEFASAPWWVWA
jgi:membrane protease YdiL (CAAX protease family)